MARFSYERQSLVTDDVGIIIKKQQQQSARIVVADDNNVSVRKGGSKQKDEEGSIFLVRGKRTFLGFDRM